MQVKRADSGLTPERIKRSKILIVDDQPAVLESLQALLRINGYVVTTVSSGAVALDLLIQESYDLVLLDLQMPGLDGQEVLRVIMQQRIEVEVVVVSGESSFFAVKSAMRNGAYDFIRKPYNPEELLTTVNNALEHHWQTRRLKHTGESLERSEKIHRFIVNNSPDFIYMLNPQGVFTYVNDKVEELLGYKRSELIGCHFSKLIHPHNADDSYNFFCEQRSGERATSNTEIRLLVNQSSQQVECLDNYELIVELNAIGIYEIDETGAKVFAGTLGCARDITERKRSEAQISYQAYHDLLTSLPNRVLFDDRISQVFAHARRNRQKFALLFLDLDRFKQINDTLGHSMGDLVLQQVSQRILECLRAEDTLCRFGGDEFALLLPNVESKENVAAVAEKIGRAVREPLCIKDHELFLSVSIGIALYPNAGQSKESLLQSADIAMYHVKANGKDSYCFYSDAMEGTDSSYLSVERDLYLALEQNQFEVFFQPRVDPFSHIIVGMEALLRWHHPEKGLIYPGDFIWIAEESKLIVPIGDWVLESTCEELVRWRKQRLPQLKISLNISPVQLERPNYVQKFIETLQKHNLPASVFELEVTEQGLLRGQGMAVRNLRQLREYGISVALDDFGRGYSSLSSLQNFPVNTLKIDRSFVREIEDELPKVCAVDAIAMMAKGLNLHMAAEGVENLLQLEYLRNLGCSEVQGYLYGKAMPAQATLDILSNQPAEGPHFILPD
ncbi:PAS domain S-box-containing protein/diguanylate cyclase (GGDEF) domain-containing protein [Malonomonas rubra DSM 5091]|uniref:PAS domain S-box-containing protein/diguanylate cyclase (GGDEF) domain-containing protein n=1 Tax=Malonomonas rubra DSM 5091 TaxID=1122189 RepID=A0A1M6FE60_MALRU|nr:EAL domain-containing protein [Malonomonas rubra]SHI95926.1 PAS domain S-box-containing protein/diguanylate cyclase (GGDEF) domain-containing protein [Malonomonas rubra DSM 5091]